MVKTILDQFGIIAESFNSNLKRFSIFNWQQGANGRMVCRTFIVIVMGVVGRPEAGIYNFLLNKVFKIIQKFAIN